MKSENIWLDPLLVETGWGVKISSLETTEFANPVASRLGFAIPGFLKISFGIRIPELEESSPEIPGFDGQ